MSWPCCCPLPEAHPCGPRKKYGSSLRGFLGSASPTGEVASAAPHHCATVLATVVAALAGRRSWHQGAWLSRHHNLILGAQSRSISAPQWMTQCRRSALRPPWSSRSAEQRRREVRRAAILPACGFRRPGRGHGCTARRISKDALAGLGFVLASADHDQSVDGVRGCRYGVPFSQMAFASALTTGLMGVSLSSPRSPAPIAARRPLRSS